MTIGARLQDLVDRTANDIKECANVCDTYSKKRLLVKVLKGPIWDDTLKGFIQMCLRFPGRCMHYREQLIVWPPAYDMFL